VRWLSKLFEFVGKVGLFSLRVVVNSQKWETNHSPSSSSPASPWEPS
jgi:hypothetical protein